VEAEHETSPSPGRGADAAGRRHVLFPLLAPPAHRIDLDGSIRQPLVGFEGVDGGGHEFGGDIHGASPSQLLEPAT
jgi:hypothetical protein